MTNPSRKRRPREGRRAVHGPAPAKTNPWLDVQTRKQQRAHYAAKYRVR